MSVIVDSSEAMESLKKVIVAMFHLAPERVEIVTTGEVRNEKPLLVVEVRVDGARAAGEVKVYVDGFFAAVHRLTALREAVDADLRREVATLRGHAR